MLEDSSYDYNDHIYAYPVSVEDYTPEENELTDDFWKDYYFTFNFYVSANVTMDVCTYYF